MKVLLHICCGPCLIYPLEVLRQEGLEVEAYFYNPNIHPEDEFLRRRSACLGLANSSSLKVNSPDYNQEDFYKALTDRERPGRCLGCWRLRLEETARFAKDNHFDNFTTTLLVSPYQDIVAIGKIGEDVGRYLHLDFLYRDFRSGFKEAHNQARSLGIYCQKYCGCSYSLEERNIAVSRAKNRQ